MQALSLARISSDNNVINVSREPFLRLSRKHQGWPGQPQSVIVADVSGWLAWMPHAEAMGAEVLELRLARFCRHHFAQNQRTAADEQHLRC